MLRRIRRFSFVTQLTLLFIFITVITGVVIGFFWGAFYQNFKKNSSDSIANAGNALDLFVADMNLSAMSMLDSADFSTSKITTKYGSFLAISRTLSNYVACTDLISNAFYLNSDTQTVYTTGKPYLFENFSHFNNGYHLTADDYPRFFLRDQRNFWIPAQILAQGQPAVLTHVITYSLQADGPDYALVIHVNTDKLQALLQSYLPSENASIVLLDTDGKLLYVVGGTLPEESWIGFSDLQHGTSAHHTLNIEAVAYEMFTTKSAESAILYGLVIPKGDIFNASHMGQYLILYLLFALVLAALFIWLGRRWLQKNRRLLPRRIAMQLYQGGYANETELLDDLVQMGVSKPDNLLCQALIAKLARPMDTLCDEHTAQTLSDHFSSLLENIPVLVAYCAFADTFFILINGTAENLRLALDRLLRNKERLEELENADIALGIGTTAPLAQAARTVNEAKIAINSRFVKGENAVIDFQTLNTHIGNLSYPTDRIAQYSNALVTRKESAVQASLAPLMNIITHSDNLFFATCLMYDIVNTTLKAMADMNYSSAIFHNITTRNMSRFTSIEDIKGILDALITDIIIAFEQGTLPSLPSATTDRTLLLEEIKKHIQAHYSDADFSVKSLAGAFDMSISNLSHFFKKGQDINVSDYILQLRIEKSKALICTTNNTFQDISFACGYVNISTFLRQFKQSENMTPSQYRALHRKSGT